jgi:hypothetical protein
VQDELLAHAKLIAQFGPTLGRPRVDRLEGSRHANLKELRFDAAGGVWRVPLRSIRYGGPCFWSPETRRARARVGFIEH